MRQQSTIQINVRNVVIGGEKPLVCLPLMGEDREKLFLEARELQALEPDLLEWRIDGYEDVGNIDLVISSLRGLRRIIGDIPLIFTCRIHSEGGFKKISEEKRLELFAAAIASDNIDLVDVELCSGISFIEAVKKDVRVGGVKLILSYHNIIDTPGEAFIYSKLVEGQLTGADIVKLAVMPRSYTDVLTLLSATNRARNERVELPIITMSMGRQGMISRLAGALFGSDITFAAGKKSSASGQIPLEDLRAGLELLFRSGENDRLWSR